MTKQKHCMVTVSTLMGGERKYVDVKKLQTNNLCTNI